DAFLAIVCLVASALAFGVPFEGGYVILALLVFSLMFPGRPARSSSTGALAREVIGSWILVMTLLVVLGWATRTLEWFDARVLAAWLVAAPIAIFLGQLTMPVVLPRILAAEGMERVAVIAGAGDLGRNLAERIKAAPFLGVRVAGFFEDREVARLPA